MKKRIYPLFAIFTILALLAACGDKAGSSADVPPTPVASLVTAEGHIVPIQSVYLSFLASGRVSEILVTKGERVQTGEVLARLGDRQQAQAALAAARLAQTGTQQDYDKIMRTVGVLQAQAWLDYLDAQKNRASAQLAWDRLDIGSIESDILDAEADVTSRKTDLEDAQKDFDKYSDLPVTNNTRKTYEDDLRTAQTNYDLAVQKLEALQAQRDLPSARLSLAISAEAEAQHTYENMKTGPDADPLAIAHARLESANAQAAAAQFALDSYDLKAPFSGTVEDINISVYQMISPETWAIALADTSKWYVDTNDLGEMDVVGLNVGQAATISVDAFPGETFSGVIDSISGAPTVQGGDILYKVRILLDDRDTRLRWGMTVEVTFELAEATPK